MSPRGLCSFVIGLWIVVGCLLSGTALAGEVKSASLAGVARWQDAAPADLAATATWQLPGVLRVRYGIEDLRVLFGTRNVRLEPLGGAEGEVAQGAVLFPEDVERRAEVFFQDEARHRGITMVRVQGRHTRWHLAGVRLGMTLAELVRWNGAPVSYSGFDWDYGGMVTAAHGGRLAAILAGGTVGRGFIRLDRTEQARGYPLGESSVRSDDRRYASLLGHIRVSELGFSFEP